jgi:3-deoxy-7-phosphoheptulonate synthase
MRPSLTGDGLLQLIDLLSPWQRPGRLTLIRALQLKVEEHAAARSARCCSAGSRNVLWSCDPMHGNTIT